MKQFPLFFSLCFMGILVFNSCKRNNDIEPIDDFRNYSFEEPSVTGNAFYIDPVNGSADGDGSSSDPWRTLQEVIEDGLIEFYKHSENSNPNSELVLVNEGAPVKGGDRLILRTGYHGFVAVNNFIFEDWLTIEAEDGHTPVLSQFKATGAFRNFYLKSLTIRRDSYEGTENYWEADDINHNTNTCLYLASSDFWGLGSDVKVNGLILKTTDDASAWTAADWLEKVGSGIGVRNAKNIEVVNCTIENIYMGISVSENSENSAFINNKVKGFAGDGARIISNDILFAYNTIQDCYKINENHDDCIQSWTVGEDGSVGTGVVRNVILRGNLLIGQTNPSHPLAGYPQGIGCFDGFFENWIVENNVVITNHYHGITFSGFRGGKIANNTVIDQVAEDDISPWIRISEHKNGTPSENCIAINNIVFRTMSVSGPNVTESNNYVIGRDNYSQIESIFVDPEHFDMHLLVNDFTQTNIIDQGVTNADLLSSEIDKDNYNRTLPPDLGAYEAK